MEYLSAVGGFEGLTTAIAQDLLYIWGFNSPDHSAFAGRIASIATRVPNKDVVAISAVKHWRRCLCQGEIDSRAGAASFVRLFGCRTRPNGCVSLAEIPPQVLTSISQAYLLFWKAESLKVEKSSWAEFGKRISTSGHPSLSQPEKDRIRRALCLPRAPRWERLAGRNGPGAVAGGQKGGDKWFFAERPRSIPLMFFCTSIHHAAYFDWKSTVKYGITRALQVPKDVRGPRFISCEPLSYAHAQFALESELRKVIRRHFSNHVRLEDQAWHNQMMLTLPGEVATIDLSDASDYVSRRLVSAVFPNDWKRLLFECRSSFVDAEGVIYPLRAFAPMGSALCFVVMTLVIAAALRAAGLRHFHVYGDDVICLKDDYPIAIETLTKLGLKCNHQKCCPSGLFIESCGLELLYDSESEQMTNCTPHYIRRTRQTSANKVQDLTLGVFLRRKGWKTVSQILLTRSGLASGGSFLASCRKKWDRNRQVMMYCVPVERPVCLITDEIDDYPALYKWNVHPSNGELSTRANQFSSGPTKVVWTWLDKESIPLWVKLDHEYHLVKD